MKSRKETVSLLVGIALIALTGWMVLSFFGFLAGVGEEVLAAAITALVGLGGILYAQWYSKSRQISDSHRPEKIAVYETYFNLIERFTDEDDPISVLDDEAELPKDLRDEFKKLSRGLIIWASPEVISAWNKFRTHSAPDGKKEEVLLVVDDMLQAIRKDLGNSNWGLKRGDVIKCYLQSPKDIDDLRERADT